MAGVADCGILAASRKPCIAFPSNQSLVPKKRPRLRSGTGRFPRDSTSAPLGGRAHTERSRGHRFSQTARSPSEVEGPISTGELHMSPLWGSFAMDFRLARDIPPLRG
jgi:hypothetical protein